MVGYDGKFKYLVNDKGEFVPRDDVWYKGVVTATADKWLDIGCGAGSAIGPELGFGHMVGNHHDEPVLILKASQGNRSLGWDFLPPGSESFEVHGCGRHHLGLCRIQTIARTLEERNRAEADRMVCRKTIRRVLRCGEGSARQVRRKVSALERPGLRDRRLRLVAGTQGRRRTRQRRGRCPCLRYEHNLAHLIKTLRKEFNAPKAPFVVATCGFNGGEGWEPGSSADTIFKAQMNVSDPAKHPDLAGTVKSVDTRPFYRKPEVSPRNQSFHYHGNAETYMLVGESMGKAMVELQKK